MEMMIAAAFKAGYTPREVVAVTGASVQQVNAHLDCIRASQVYIAKHHGRSILPIYANL